MAPPELLAPAGGREALEAAVDAGADAVYFGLSEFSARARAGNFEPDELPSLMDLLRSKGVRGYAAMNTLLFPDELDRAAVLLSKLAEAGADAVIVQDLGLAKLAHEMVPGLPVHASTQMTLAHGASIELTRELLGVSRVILPRELSLEQIRRIRSTTDSDLEVFVHGSLCLSYGGQCLASAVYGDRSGNRGSCAQPCRLPYALDNRRGFPLSPLDLSAWELIPELVSLGVCGFKIEGRLKNSRYVGAVTAFYRRALDAALEKRAFVPSQEDLLDLAQGFSRGFTRGWLGGVPRGSIVEGSGPESRGIPAGKVVRCTPSGVLIEPTLALEPGDGVAFGSGESRSGGRILKVLEHAPGCLELRLRAFAGDVRPGTDVWKTSSSRPRSWVCERKRRRLDIEVNAPLGGALRIRAGKAEVSWEEPLTLAEKHPCTPELLREQLGRLGDSPFELGRLDLRAPDPVLVPKSVLNRLRRELLAALHSRSIQVRTDGLESLRRKVLPAPPSGVPMLTVLVRDEEQLEAAVSSGCSANSVYCESPALRQGFGAAGPRVIEPGDRILLPGRAPVVLVRNLATLHLLEGLGSELVADWRLNASNELSVQTLLDMGFSWVTPAYDLSPQGLKELLLRCGGGRLEVIVHQHAEMFHTKYCFRRCTGGLLRLKDRKGVTHSIRPDGLGRHTVFNGKAESRLKDIPGLLKAGVRRFRVELLDEGPEEVSALLKRFRQALSPA